MLGKSGTRCNRARSLYRRAEEGRGRCSEGSPVAARHDSGFASQRVGTVNRRLLLDARRARYRDADKDGTLTMIEMRAWKALAMTPKPS